MAEPPDRKKSGKDAGNESHGPGPEPPATKGFDDDNRPSKQADGDPGPEAGEGPTRDEDEATVHDA